MRKKNYKGRCEKRTLPKFVGLCRTYDAVQFAYAELLAKNEAVTEIRCNVVLEGDGTSDYMTDFVCLKSDGKMMVRECVSRTHLSKPQTAALLEASRSYWLRHGVEDWGMVTNE